MDQTKIIILAAGKGNRMENELPKMLLPVAGRSMIERLLDSVTESGIDESPVIIVGYKKELVINALGDKYHYIEQESPLGTGHAVNMAKDYLKDKAERVIVLYGDQPFTGAETIKKLAEKQKQTGKEIVMATVKLPDFKDWRVNFWGFSRVIRDEAGKIIRTIENKDATDEERKITEVNPCYFCFKASWLWAKLDAVKNDNAQGEYYLTDLVKLATEEGIEIESVEIQPHEALGANTKAELERLEKFAK